MGVVSETYWPCGQSARLKPECHRRRSARHKARGWGPLGFDCGAGDVPQGRWLRRYRIGLVRTYSGEGASELLDLLGQREDDVKALISGVPGFVNYAAVRSGDGGVTVTVCEDKAGTDESSRRAAEWVKENVTATGTPPAISEGNTVLHF
jgi:hypothetical protein